MNITPFQQRCIDFLNRSNTSRSTADMAHCLKTSNVAIVSSMRSLERKGLAGSHRWPNDQWAALYWFLRGEVKK